MELTRIGHACFRDGRRISREDYEDCMEAERRRPSPTLEAMQAEVEAAPNLAPTRETCLECGEMFVPRRMTHVAGERGTVAVCPRCGQGAEMGGRFGEED